MSYYSSSRAALDASNGVSVIANRIDAADGILDGHYYGTRINGATFSGTRHTSPVVYSGVRHTGPVVYSGARHTGPVVYRVSANALDAADGVIDGRYYGTQISGGTLRRYGGYSSSPIRRVTVDALDAADGVMDGRYYGTRIYGTTASGHGGYVSPTRRRATADALDAADGVMDGQYYGTRVSGATLSAGRSLSPRTQRAHPSDLYYFSRPASLIDSRAAESLHHSHHRASPRAPSPRTKRAAAALDAADGVMDGTYFGTPIANASTSRPGSPRRVIHSRPHVTTNALNAADALDAADGVMDGKFRGRKIIGSTQNKFEDALDAADGVMDGQFFGKRLAASSRDVGNPFFGMRVTEKPIRGTGRTELKIVAVTSGGPAQRGGLLVGDILIKFCNIPLTSQSQLSELMHGSPVGSTVLFEVNRFQKRKYLPIRVEGDVFTSRRAAADALDLADGVYDGTYFGTNVPGSTARAAIDALDASDGIIDGRYYGKQL